MEKSKKTLHDLIDLLKKIKRYGFSDTYLARKIGVDHLDFRNFRKKSNVNYILFCFNDCFESVES